jgi:hypothetical protein
LKYWRGRHVIVFAHGQWKFHRCVVCGTSFKFSSEGVGPECAHRSAADRTAARQLALERDRDRYRAEVLDLGLTIDGEGEGLGSPPRGSEWGEEIASRWSKAKEPPTDPWGGSGAPKGTGPAALGAVKMTSEEARLMTCWECGYTGGRHSRLCTSGGKPDS